MREGENEPWFQKKAVSDWRSLGNICGPSVTRGSYRYSNAGISFLSWRKDASDAEEPIAADEQERFLSILSFWHKVEFFIPFDLTGRISETVVVEC
jgi:hypothetical protein